MLTLWRPNSWGIFVLLSVDRNRHYRNQCDSDRIVVIDGGDDVPTDTQIKAWHETREQRIRTAFESNNWLPNMLSMKWTCWWRWRTERRRHTWHNLPTIFTHIWACLINFMEISWTGGGIANWEGYCERGEGGFECWQLKSIHFRRHLFVVHNSEIEFYCDLQYE